MLRADFDNDGHPDLFVTGVRANHLFRNPGDGTFEEVAAQADVAFNENGVAVSGMGAEFRDYDNDGREDLFITALNNETFELFHNQGAASSKMSPSRLEDIFTANRYVVDNAELSSGRHSLQPNLVLTNARTSFPGRTLPARHWGSHGVASIGTDAWIWWPRASISAPRFSGTGPPAAITGLRSNYVARNPIGTAIGALAEVDTGGGKQWDRVAGSTSRRRRNRVAPGLARFSLTNCPSGNNIDTT